MSDYTTGLGGRFAARLGLSRTRSQIIWKLHKGLHWLYRRRLSRYPELAALFDRLGAKAYATPECFQASAGDMLCIYETVLKRKPRYLLELGAGMSTNVIALALQRLQEADPQYQPTFVAVEESAEWLAHHERSILPDLRGLVDLRHAPAVAAVCRGEPVAHFTGLPDHPYDFVHVDGPGLTKFGVHASADPLHLRYGEHAVILFDGREATARFTAAHRPDFKLRREPLILKYVMERE